MKFVIIQNSVLNNKFSYVFIMLPVFIIMWKSIFKIISLLLRSIEVFVQDTKLIDGHRQPLIRKMNYKMD